MRWAPLIFLTFPVTGHARVPLRVALYPYVPDPVAQFAEIEVAFEAAHPSIDLQRAEAGLPGENAAADAWLADLYAPGVAAGMLTGPLAADVIEVDAVLLPELRAGKLLQPIPRPPLTFVHGAAEALEADGETWGVPRWVCANFVFHRGDAPLEATDLPGLAAELGEVSVDLTGASNLGEWHLISTFGRDAASGGQVDPAVEQDLRALLASCDDGLCRDQAHHDAGRSTWARRFFSGLSPSYIGYSETAHFGLEEAAHACIGRPQCPSEADIRVDPLPVRPPGAKVGWVDGLVVRRGVRGRKRRAALIFLRWMVEPTTYDRVLTPRWPEPPRYLLPAVPGWKSSWGVLYPKFEAAWGTRVFPTGDLPAWRQIGESLDQSLRSSPPPDATAPASPPPP